MSPRCIALALACALSLSACALTRPAPSFPDTPAPANGSPAGGSAQPAPGTPAPAPEATPLPTPGEKPYTPPPKQFRLGPAASALVAQAHQQSASGDYGQAAATLERALRIEPDNPLLWTELGRVRLGENDPAQAESMGHKALALATGDPAAQSSAWHLIADSLRARGRNGDAAEADRHSAAAVPHAG
jgi:tetratricopeptide (TPR) repeat protein